MPFIVKANFRGMLINDEIKGYFEPTVQFEIVDGVDANFGFGMEIHATGWNMPTGRLGLRFKL